MQAFFYSTAVVAISEIGDKTQLLSIVLAARYGEFVWVLLGTTLGMMLAKVAAIWLGARAMHFVSLKLARWEAALLMAASGAYVLWAGLFAGWRARFAQKLASRTILSFSTPLLLGLRIAHGHTI